MIKVVRDVTLTLTHSRYNGHISFQGVDDAIALCLALDVQFHREGDYVVKAITCVHGNTKVENVRTNVAKCRNVFGRHSIPSIHLGAAFALAETAEASNDTAEEDGEWHGKDGLGDAVGVAEPCYCEQDTGEAVDVLLKLCEEAEQAGALLYIAALGPLTNIAHALNKNVKLCRLVEGIYIMGGCGNARGNASRVAEFNILADVDAACKVFAEWPSAVTVISWELSKIAAIPWTLFDDWFFTPRNPVSEFMRKVCEKPYGKSEREQQSGAVICDALCVACFIDDSIITSSDMVHVEVENTSSICRGMTVLDCGHSFREPTRERKVRWVTAVDQGKWHKLLQTLACNPHTQ